MWVAKARSIDRISQSSIEACSNLWHCSAAHIPLLACCFPGGHLCPAICWGSVCVGTSRQGAGMGWEVGRAPGCRDMVLWGPGQGMGALGGQTLWQAAVLGQPGQPLLRPFTLTMRIAFEAQGEKGCLLVFQLINSEHLKRWGEKIAVLDLPCN